MMVWYLILMWLLEYNPYPVLPYVIVVDAIHFALFMYWMRPWEIK